MAPCEKKAPVTGHRHPRPYGRLFFTVACGQQHRFTLRLLGQYAAPWINDGRVSVSLARPRMDPALCRRQHVTLGFDGTRADQNVPVRSPVTAVNADGAVISSAPASRSAVYSSGKRRS